jgi:hypothetical protein
MVEGRRRNRGRSLMKFMFFGPRRDYDVVWGSLKLSFERREGF